MSRFIEGNVIVLQVSRKGGNLLHSQPTTKFSHMTLRRRLHLLLNTMEENFAFNVVIVYLVQKFRVLTEAKMIRA